MKPANCIVENMGRETGRRL